MNNPYGEITSEVPQGFVPYQQWPEYYIPSDCDPRFKPEVVGIRPKGMRRGVWPLCIEDYVSNDEPDLSYSDPRRTARNRIIAWQRISRTDIPAGWHTWGNKAGARIDVFSEIRSDEQYWLSWSKGARYDRKRWFTKYAGLTYDIEKITFDDYSKLYTHSSVGKTMGTFPKDVLERQLAHKGEHVQIWGARHRATNTVRAAIAVVHSPTYASSYYLAGCIHREIGHDPAMVGLIDHWFKNSQRMGVRFLLFGSVWTRGKPRSWRGFSSFKARFRPQLIACPPLLWRLERGNFF